MAASFERSLANPTEELQVSFTEAYGKTLKKHHNFLVAPIFAVRGTLRMRRARSSQGPLTCGATCWGPVRVHSWR